ncbi:MAG: hypothetical protein OXE46_15665 [Chloroflexi bacterium]|nr:hypothetical protein [Chloroflexota bacterium]
MLFGSDISWEFVLTIAAIIGSVLRIQYHFSKQLAEQRKEMKADNEMLRMEFKADNAALREEMNAHNAELRREINDSRAEYRSENAAIRADLRRIEDKVDDNTQRLARLEGIILAREGMVDTIVE